MDNQTLAESVLALPVSGVAMSALSSTAEFPLIEKRSNESSQRKSHPFRRVLPRSRRVREVTVHQSTHVHSSE